MSNEELARLIRAEIIKAESALANVDALASADFRGSPPDFSDSPGCMAS